MRIFLNGLGASAGAGLTYLYNVVPRLSSLPDVHTIVALQSHLRPEFRHLPKVDVLQVAVPESIARRFWFEQNVLPRLIREAKADVLISAGNFAMRNPPVPQILLSGNSLYTSADFYRDLRQRREYRMWIDTKFRGIFAKKSVQWADCTVAPSRAFAEELGRWTGREVSSIHHGFDADVFFGDKAPLATAINQKLRGAQGSLKLLFVSHYNYYRNFETLFRAIALVRKRAPEKNVRLFLTCTLDDSKTPGEYKTATAARLTRDLGIQDEVIELGAITYRQLHHVYRACDVYVSPAYAETFAHPLVEARACGLPVIASDIPAHREICRGALFFHRFSPEQLAQCILAIAPGAKKSTVGPEAVPFNWSEHLQKLLAVATRLKGEKGTGDVAEKARLRNSLPAAS